MRSRVDGCLFYIKVILIFSLCIWKPVSSGEVTVSWGENKEVDLAGYKIYYGTDSRNYSDNVDVGLTTTHKLTGLTNNTEYYFSVTAYDTLKNESDYSAEICAVLGDEQPLEISSVTTLSSFMIRIIFNKKVDSQSAQTVENYKIDHDVTVNSVTIMEDQKTIHLATTIHNKDIQYSVTVNNVKDISIPANTIAVNSSVIYSFPDQDVDTTPPTISLVNAASDDILSVYFSEPVDVNSATNKNNYTISNGINILSAEMGSNSNIITLYTEKHESGQLYSVTVNNILDASANRNEIAANSNYSYTWEPGDIVGPTISLVSLTRVDQIDVLFNETLDRETAEDPNNYRISGGIDVLSASLDSSERIVQLETTFHEPDKIYILNIQDLTDNSTNKNIIQANSSYTYLYEPADRTGPIIARVDIADKEHIRIHFNEIVDRTSAENINNYQLNEGVVVKSALLDVTGKVVDLQTTPHKNGTLQVLLVNGVKDASDPGNEILPNSSYTYVFGTTDANAGPTLVQVNVLNSTTLVVQFSEKIEINRAQDVTNYFINRDVSVISADLDENGTEVILTTSGMKAEDIYILTVNNIQDEYGYQILANSSYSYIYEGEDNVGPIVTLVELNDAEHMDVLFNEKLSQEEAEDLNNYSITGNISILDARLDGSGRIVHLTTSPHATNKLYILLMNNLVDESQNTIVNNTSYAYLYESLDNLAPIIAHVNVIDQQRLSITFNESVDPITAIDASFYSLNNEATVKSAEIGTTPNVIELTTSFLEFGKIYILMVNNVRDEFDNEIAPNSSYAFTYGQFRFDVPPAITSVRALDKDKVEVAFNIKVNKSTAELVSNYSLGEDVQVLEAELDTSFTKVVLKTTPHENGKIYVLMAQNIGRYDDPTLIISPYTPYFYIYEDESASQVSVLDIKVLAETLVEITYSKAVDRLSAENRNNYEISNDVAIFTAELDATGRKVLLETSRLKPGLAYTMKITQVRSKLESYNFSVANSMRAFTYLPNLQVEIESDAETSMSYLEVGQEYYVDRNYLITEVPETLYRARMIMTSNNDKNNSYSGYVTINLSQAAFVYIAYDSRALTVPNWLYAYFSKTDMKIGVSENSEYLELWQGYFPAGTLVLGGNNSTGARGAGCMYVVLIQEPSFDTSPGGELEGSYGNKNATPNSVELLPNYPNPFNPRTTISFDLPFERYVKLVVYNILGRRVKTLYDSYASAGQHNVVWNGDNMDGVPVTSGIYFYRLETWDDSERNGLPYRENVVTMTRKMTFIK